MLVCISHISHDGSYVHGAGDMPPVYFICIYIGLYSRLNGDICTYDVIVKPQVN